MYILITSVILLLGLILVATLLVKLLRKLKIVQRYIDQHETLINQENKNERIDE